MGVAKVAPPPTRGWWGDGLSPNERWPGVTLDLTMVWVPLIGHQLTEGVDDETDEPVQVWVDAEGRDLEDWHGDAGGRWETPDHRFYFDVEAATRAVDFFPTYLRHHIGEFANHPFILLDYQRLLLTAPLFGWKRTVDGLRRFRKVFGFLPKGAGKSPWGAGTGLYCTLCDGEAAAEVYAVAADKDQARTVHSNAKIMVEESEELSTRCEVWKDAIYHPLTRSTYKVLSADAATKHGFRPHVVVFDELHAQPNRDLYEALKKSMVKRRQPIMLLLTHAGDDDEGICYEEYDYAKRVLSGTIPDDTCLPVIFEASKADNWKAPETWARVNPGHGITVQRDGIRAECLEAANEPRKLNDFLRFHLNRWVNQATAWIPIDWWDACAVPVIDDAHLLTLDCAAGLDLAQKWDLACFNVVFREYLPSVAATPVQVLAEEPTGQIVQREISLNYRLYSRPFFWIPEDTLKQHEEDDGVPYSLWRSQLSPGTPWPLITATEGNVIDYTRIFQDITTKILPHYPRLKQGLIGYDPAFATDLATKLKDVAGLKVGEVLQNYKMLSEPSQIVEALIKGRRIIHDGHRVLRWNWENAAVKTDDAGRIRPVKPRSQAKRVDGAVALIMGAKALSLMDPAAPKDYQLFVIGGRPR